MYCQYCGASISDDAVFCPKCGQSVDAHQTEKTGEQAKSNGSHHDLDNSETATTEKAPHLTESWRCFVDTRYHYYADKWSNSSDPANHAGWNWASFFVGLFWLGYRKMFGILLMILAIYLVTDAIVYFTGIGFLNSVIPFAIFVYLGAKGNSLYYRHVSDKVAVIGSDKACYQYRKAGGGSGAGCLGSLLLFVAYILISEYIFGLI